MGRHICGLGGNSAFAVLIGNVKGQGIWLDTSRFSVLGGKREGVTAFQYPSDCGMLTVYPDAALGKFQVLQVRRG
jgi:hypothetical protein